LMPDTDEDARRKSLADRTKAFYDAIQSAKANGFEVSPEYLKKLADDFGVIEPTLPSETARAPTVTLAPTDVAKVVLVNEARASAGLGPLVKGGVADPDGFLTVSAFAAKQDSLASAPPPVTISPPTTNGVGPPQVPTLPAAKANGAPPQPQ
jgi:hypothetical protein